MADKVKLECTECKNRNYDTTKNKKNTQGDTHYITFLDSKATNATTILVKFVTMTRVEI